MSRFCVNVICDIVLAAKSINQNGKVTPFFPISLQSAASRPPPWRGQNLDRDEVWACQNPSFGRFIFRTTSNIPLRSSSPIGNDSHPTSYICRVQLATAGEAPSNSEQQPPATLVCRAIIVV